MGASSTLLPIQQFQILSPEQANPFGYGLAQGINDYLNAQRARTEAMTNQTLRAQLPYAGPQAAANVGLTQSQGNLFGAQASAIPSEIQLRQAEAGLYGTEAQQKAIIVRQMQQDAGMAGNQNQGTNANANVNGMNGGGYNPGFSAGQNNNVNSDPSEVGGASGVGGATDAGSANTNANGNSPSNNIISSDPRVMQYGIPIPQMNRQDRFNQLAYNTNTIGPAINNAFSQIDQQKVLMSHGANTANIAAQSAANFSNLYSIFNHQMDNATLKGPQLGWVGQPNSDTSALATDATRQIDKTAALMTPQAVENMKAAMGNARFTNLDTHLATSLAADRSMSPTERKNAASYADAVATRAQKVAQIWNVLNNPTSGARAQDVDALVTSYQNNNPLTDGKKMLARTPEPVEAYLTPEAIASVRATGSYNPKLQSKNTSPPAQTTNVAQPSGNLSAAQPMAAQADIGTRVFNGGNGSGNSGANSNGNTSGNAGSSTQVTKKWIRKNGILQLAG